jgi:hypothetical protein
VREIGSEFWLERDSKELSHDRDGCYVLSGRTAIVLIIQNIVKTRPVHNAYLPAWCCDSMVEPFLSKGIHVELYDMSFDDSLHYHVDTNKMTDIFYVSNYFGYENTIDVEIIFQFKQRGAIIIYDRTHSFLTEETHPWADYSFASIRKWMGVLAGAVVSGVKDCQLKPYQHLACKEKAMRMKKAFIDGDENIDKQAFLNLYAGFGHHLVEDYQNYEMDDLSYALYKSTDLATMRRRRRENAQYLHEHLKGVKFIGELTDNAVPLFVPVFFESKEQRDVVRKMLIDAQIYCPIHWPKNKLITPEKRVNQIFDTELSLICDQRYNIIEMQKIIETIQ